MTAAIRVLYAEDNAQDADLTRAHFAEHAPDVALEIVDTGQGCLDRLAARECDLLLLDYRLPDMDGLDVLRLLVRSGSPVAMPVVLITGCGDEELVVKALHLGAANYVPKTGDYLQTLPALLRAVIEEHRLARSRGLLSVVPRRLLYVEHFEFDIDFTLGRFADALPHVEVDVLRSCAEALARLEHEPGYDAVLVDLRMPDQNALDFVREVKSRGLRLPPFIVVSGKGDEAAAIASLKLGAVDYIVKRDGYLDQLPYVVDRAIAYDRLDRTNAQLQAELTERKRAEAEREQLQEQLLAARKLEAIGSLAGGIAHDFNNLLSVILSYTQLAIGRLPQGVLRDDLQEVNKAAERAAMLTRQLLAFSRRQVLQPVPLDLNQTISGVAVMFKRILGQDIELVQTLAPDLALTHADPVQLERVLMNLVVNARDAMPEGGKLVIATANVELSEECATHHLAVKPGTYVQLTVTDTGNGMNAETRARAFEPFFTTKEHGKGTGLGLSTVYGIVKQSGGGIWVDSEPGAGTTFKIFLPRDVSATGVTIAEPATAASSSGSETIAVVEDDPALRQLAVKILGEAGYTVLAATDGEEALARCAAHEGEVDLLLTDVVMPKMSGRRLAEELVKLRPALDVIYMSGYPDDTIVHQGVLDAGTHFLSKPFTSAELLRKIRSVLDSGRVAKRKTSEATTTSQ